MSLFSSYAYLLRKSPVARSVNWLVLIAAMAFLLTFLSHKSQKSPQIISITPQIASAGDEMTIKGTNFGKEKGSSFVEISDSKVTERAFLLWNDDEIRFLIPQSARDGLVFVGSSAGKSNPAFFVNRQSIPQTMTDSELASLSPAIDSVSPQNASVGQTITIAGSAFGEGRGSSKVFFTASRSISDTQEGEDEELFIPASENDFDYISWSSSLIELKIPDGAMGGKLFVQTPSGKSTLENIKVDSPLGQKRLHSKAVYVIQVTADVSADQVGGDGDLLLYVPKPAVFSAQPSCVLTDISPDPLIKDDAHNVIHRTPLKSLAAGGQHLSQTFAVTAYAVDGGLKNKQGIPYKNKSSALYVKHTTDDSYTPAGDKAVKDLASSIVGAEKNPCAQAKTIYTYMTDNYEVQANGNSGKATVDLIRLKKGDSCDFALLYATLCRAVDIPAIPVAGILVRGTGEAQVHWWNEVYFEGYGWLPVDIALGSSHEQPAGEDVSAKEFYFGNMDNRHVAFSRGVTQIKRAWSSSKAIGRERAYALQSLWEEASTLTSYSVLWANPIVLEAR